MHKIGGAAISPAIVLSCANVAAARVIELTTFLKEEEEKADKEAMQRRRALLRGRAFADVSSTVDEASTKRSVETVDLGAMTDFSVLHAPIALRGDPTKEEVTQRVTSMAELLESLKTAADLAKELVPAATGLAVTDAARSEFRRLAGSEKVQILIHGGEKEQPRSFHSVTKQLVADNDSDSEEEGGIIQSEFGTSLQMEKSARAKPSKKETNGEAVQSSDEDEDEDMDLSAAIKRKFK